MEDDIELLKSIIKSKKNKDNWYADELLERVSNIQEHSNNKDIHTLCSKFGKNMVKSVLNDKYKKMYKIGYIQTSGMDIPLSGSYNQNDMYKKIMSVINDC